MLSRGYSCPLEVKLDLPASARLYSANVTGQSDCFGEKYAVRHNELCKQPLHGCNQQTIEVPNPRDESPESRGKTKPAKATAERAQTGMRLSRKVERTVHRITDVKISAKAISSIMPHLETLLSCCNLYSRTAAAPAVRTFLRAGDSRLTSMASP